MVPQHTQDNNMSHPDLDPVTVVKHGGQVVFGSTLVAQNSSTPYSDATQVIEYSCFFFCLIFVA